MLMVVVVAASGCGGGGGHLLYALLLLCAATSRWKISNQVPGIRDQPSLPPPPADQQQ